MCEGIYNWDIKARKYSGYYTLDYTPNGSGNIDCRGAQLFKMDLIVWKCSINIKLYIIIYKV